MGGASSGKCMSSLRNGVLWKRPFENQGWATKKNSVQKLIMEEDRKKRGYNKTSSTPGAKQQAEAPKNKIAFKQVPLLPNKNHIRTDWEEKKKGR